MENNNNLIHQNAQTLTEKIKSQGARHKTKDEILKEYEEMTQKQNQQEINHELVSSSSSQTNNISPIANDKNQNIQDSQVAPPVPPTSFFETNVSKKQVEPETNAQDIQNESNGTVENNNVKSQNGQQSNNIDEQEDENTLHTKFGNKLIEELKLMYINDNLYFYSTENKYCVVTDKFLKHWIVKYMYKKAKKSLCEAIIFYIRNYLYSDEVVEVDKNFVNFRNGLFNLKTGEFVEHTSNIFTINQIHANFIKDFKPNNVIVNRYLDEITNYKEFRKKALLQIIGYCMTARNDIQQFVVFYGPTASNGKSTLVKIIIKIIGDENTTHKDIKAFEKQFRANGIQGKLLNIVGETQQNKVNDTSVFKSTISGDIFETDVKYSDGTNITSYIKHIFTANTLPKVADKTDGYYRKLNLLMFDNKFDVSTSTFDVDEFSIQENLDYIATLSILTYYDMTKSSVKEFANTEESNILKETYRIENDTVFAFLTDEDEAKNIYNADISRQGMYNLYTGYCYRNDFTPIGKKAFNRELRDKYHFEEKIKNNGTQYCFYRELPVSNVNNGSQAKNNIKGDFKNE